MSPRSIAAGPAQSYRHDAITANIMKVRNVRISVSTAKQNLQFVNRRRMKAFGNSTTICVWTFQLCILRGSARDQVKSQWLQAKDKNVFGTHIKEALQPQSVFGHFNYMQTSS